MVRHVSQVADAWSKVEDNSEWLLHEEVYQELIQDEVLEGRRPALDVFASNTTTKVSGAFYSKFMCPGTKGVDAMVHPWALKDQAGEMMLAYISGPFHLMGAVVRKIKDDRVDCILVGPKWPRHWWALLQVMPAVRKQVTLTHRQDLFKPGPRVTRKGAKPRHPAYKVMAWYIL